MPQIFYTQEEYTEVMQRALLAEKQVQTLESLRPQWARGFTSDSVAAQMSSNALYTLWNILGVNTQTDAIFRLQQLLKKAAS